MATNYKQRAEYKKEKKEHGQEFALASLHKKIKKAKSEALKRKFSKKSDKHTGSSPSQRKRNAGYHDPYEMASAEPERNWK